MGSLLKVRSEVMSSTRRRFNQEFKDELCQEVIDTSKPIVEVAKAYGVGPESLRRWLIKYREANGGTEEELSLPERARLKELERENQELKAETAFLKKARLGSKRQCNTASLGSWYGEDWSSRVTGVRASTGLGTMEAGSGIQ